MHNRRVAALAAWLTLSGCVGVVGAPEALVPARSTEAGVPDGAAPDVNARDGAVLDGSVPDATAPDAAPVDAPVDAPDVVQPVDPGRVTLHRLNRAEYDNTVRDLFGTTRTPARDFPADDRGYGFDNIADVLTISAVQMELYQRAAEQLVDEALFNPAVPSQRTQFEAESLTGTVGGASGSAWNLWSNGDITARFVPPAAGRYRVTVRAWQTRAGTDDARMSLIVDEASVRDVSVPALAAAPGEYTAEFTVRTTTPVAVGARFLNDYYMPDVMADRNLLVDWIRVEGPLDAAGLTNPQRQRIMVCTPTTATEAACGRQIVAAFVRRAWRRPPTGAEVTALTDLFAVARTQGEGFEAGLKLALTAAILSPHFLYRVELDAEPTSPVAHPLTDHELAARLSYFLWSSMPDDALSALADAGRLRDPAVLRAQVDRMLADPKARALTDNFAGQWLYVRALAEHDADPTLFPAYTTELRASMRAETEAYFEAFLRGDVSMAEFLTADYSFVDDRLARYYGATPAAGTGVRRTTLPAARRGLLTQGGLLAVTSHPNRTSPVRRGQWVLNQLLCEPPPPPPPNVEGLPMESMPTGSLRQRFERHRADPACATCHALMDPVGFAFEHFDAVGAWRALDSGFAIDTAGVLPGSGDRFEGPADLAQILARDPRFARCVTQQVFTYALGRGPQDYDHPVLDTLSHDWSAAGLRLRDLVARVVLSDSFRMRRGEPAGGR